MEFKNERRKNPPAPLPQDPPWAAEGFSQPLPDVEPERAVPLPGWALGLGALALGGGLVVGIVGMGPAVRRPTAPAARQAMPAQEESAAAPVEVHPLVPDSSEAAPPPLALAPAPPVSAVPPARPPARRPTAAPRVTAKRVPSKPAPAAKRSPAKVNPVLASAAREAEAKRVFERARRMGLGTAQR